MLEIQKQTFESRSMSVMCEFTSYQSWLTLLNCSDEPHQMGNCLNRRTRCIQTKWVWQIHLALRLTSQDLNSEARVWHRCSTVVPNMKWWKMLVLLDLALNYSTYSYSCLVRCKARFRRWPGVTACQDPRIQLSFTVLCARRWPLPGHAVICLACKHVTIFPEVYNLAKTGWARHIVGPKIPW